MEFRRDVGDDFAAAFVEALAFPFRQRLGPTNDRAEGRRAEEIHVHPVPWAALGDAGVIAPWVGEIHGVALRGVREIEPDASEGLAERPDAAGIDAVSTEDSISGRKKRLQNKPRSDFSLPMAFTAIWLGASVGALSR